MRLVRVVLLVLAMLMVLQAPAWAAPRPAATYLALGNSVAFGIGASNNYGYVPLLHDFLTARSCGSGEAVGCRLDLVNIAEPGATSTSLIEGTQPTQLVKAEQLLVERNHNATPTDDVRLITLDIGGNDVFGPVFEVCVPDPTVAACQATIARQLVLLAANYETILSRLRAAAGPETTIAVMTYYNPLPGCPLSDFSGLADAVLEGGPPLPLTVSGLNDIIRAAAKDNGAVVAETKGVVGSGDLVGDCLHPNDSGHAAIAGAFSDLPAVAAVAGARPGFARRS